ncbi:MAG: CAP domain-containing protein, partial [Planctomycetota bacterium]|nr:CAP domain-containing protein [Planctomycetota bacterium]
HKKPIEFTPTQPDRPRPDRPRPDRPGPDRPRPDTPVDLDREAAAKKQADAILAAAAEEAQARRFRDAAAKLATDARVLPEGSMQRVRLDGIAADYGLAAKAKDLLVAHIKAHPDHDRNVLLAPRLKVALIDADAEYLHAKVSGGRSKHAWARLPADAWISLVKRMRPEQDGCVPAAALLHVLAREPEAERMLVTAVEKGVSTDEVFARLARWRGIAMPEGGFVIHDGRYVTPAEREHLLREAQIKTAIAQLDSRKPEEREAAAKTLLEIGEPAQARFAEALERRRAYLLDEIVRSKSFSSGKYKSKLLQLLEERRKHALALIYDAAAYPYPNPQKRNQAEVEARVDKVREVWERPFDLVSQWDKKLQERIQGLTEVDSLLSQVMPGYQPELDELKERINKAIDVPGSADPSKREYSLKVIVYNTTLKTTAGTQEKANVRSVNNYRMMMGLLAVKIDEKLTRAARGHSRHMATNGYFAHNVPPPYHTPTNRTPGSRAKQQGFGGGVGENIARGPGTGHGAFMAWFRSSGHHRNMLGRGWLVMGCGRANQTWWTQLFAGGSKSLTPPDPLPPPAAPFAPDDDGKAKPGDKNGRGSEDDAE